MRNALLLAALLMTGAAYAQDKGKSDGAAAPRGGGKMSTIDFEDDTIEGDLTRPDGEYIEARKKVKHSNLIRIREDFEEKVMQSVGEL